MSMWRSGSGEQPGAIKFDQPRDEAIIGQAPIFAHQAQAQPQRATLNDAPEWLELALDTRVTGLFDATDDNGNPTQKPQGINNTEWRIIVRRCVMRQSWDDIGKAYSESPSRVRFFAEAAARKLFPERCIQAQARALGHHGIAITSDAPIVSAAETFYSAVGSPFGATPEGLTAFMHAMANDPVTVKMVRDHVGNGGIRAGGNG